MLIPYSPIRKQSLPDSSTQSFRFSNEFRLNEGPHEFLEIFPHPFRGEVL